MIVNFNKLIYKFGTLLCLYAIYKNAVNYNNSKAVIASRNKMQYKYIDNTAIYNKKNPLENVEYINRANIKKHEISTTTSQKLTCNSAVKIEIQIFAINDFLLIKQQLNVAMNALNIYPYLNEILPLMRVGERTEVIVRNNGFFPQSLKNHNALKYKIHVIDILENPSTVSITNSNNIKSGDTKQYIHCNSIAILKNLNNNTIQKVDIRISEDEILNTTLLGLKTEDVFTYNENKYQITNVYHNN